MPKSKIYTVGGTVQATGGLYIKRKADAELLDLCREGNFAYVLTTRQVGKSSLIIRTANELANDGIKSVAFELNLVGDHVDRDQWYLGLITEINKKLGLKCNVFDWWDSHSRLSAVQRFSYYFSEVVLNEIKGKVVIFIDEIELTINLSFASDFFAAIRSMYNERANNANLQRLSFVLVGTTTPTELISDPKRTPFNIGKRVDLTDFTFEEALPLSTGLDESTQRSTEVLRWVLEWTGGHPYLTQKICLMLSKAKTIIREDVTNTIQKAFFSETGKNDGNLLFVNDMILKRAANPRGLLRVYRAVLSGQNIKDDEKSVDISHLKLSGLVVVSKGILQVRNQIYRQAFNLNWIDEHFTQFSEIFKLAVSVVGSFLFIFLFSVFFRSILLGIALLWGVVALMYQREREKLVERLESLFSKPFLLQSDNNKKIPLYPKPVLDEVARGVISFLNRTDLAIISIKNWLEVQYFKRVSAGKAIFKQFRYLVLFLILLLFLYAAFNLIVSSLDVIGIQISGYFSGKEPLYIYNLLPFFLIAVSIWSIIRAKSQSDELLNTDSKNLSNSWERNVAVYILLSSVLDLIVEALLLQNRWKIPPTFRDMIFQARQLWDIVLLPINVPLASTLIRQVEIYEGIQSLFLLTAALVYGLIYLISKVIRVLFYTLLFSFDVVYRSILFLLFLLFYYIATPLESLTSIGLFSQRNRQGKNNVN
jgi:hypothetical protein